MGESRNVYVELEDKVLLRTEDVYQNPVGEDITSYSDTLLSVVANFKNSGRPEGFNAQSMVGKSKRGEVACRLFAVINPETEVIEKVGFKSRGCLAITACASVVCTMIEGRTLAEALTITIDEVRDALDGVPAGNVNTLYFSTEAVRALVGDYLARQGATLAEIDAVVGCDEDSVACMMCEHCSLRSIRMDMRVEELEAAAQSAPTGAAVIVAAVGDASGDAPLDEGAESFEDLSVVTEVPVAVAPVEVSEEVAVDDAAEEAEAKASYHPQTEHDAIALALEAVRGASRASRLTTPELWEELDLVPESMSLEDLEMAVYDELMAWQEAHPEEAVSTESATALDASGNTPAMAGKARAARRSPFGSQRAVGAPRLFAKKKSAQAGEGVAAEASSEEAAEALVPSFSQGTDDGAAHVTAVVEVVHEDTPTSAAPLSEAPETEEADEAAVAAALAALDSFVEEPDDEPLDDDNPFPTLQMPEGKRMVRRNGVYQLVAEEEVEGAGNEEQEATAVALVETPEDGQSAEGAVESEEELPIRCENIALLMGRSGYYLYDRTVMTDAYAHWSFLAAEADPLVTFADCVREDSRVYPRPYNRDNLANEPFNMDADAVEAAFAAAQADPDYADIERLEASNGDVYFYSTRYLARDYAQSLAEWASVERFRNV